MCLYIVIRHIDGCWAFLCWCTWSNIPEPHLSNVIEQNVLCVGMGLLINMNSRIIILCTTFEASVKVNNIASKHQILFKYALYTISCGCNIVAKTCTSSNMSQKSLNYRYLRWCLQSHICSFTRQLFFGKLYIRYTKPTFRLSCRWRLWRDNRKLLHISSGNLKYFPIPKLLISPTYPCFLIPQKRVIFITYMKFSQFLDYPNNIIILYEFW